MEHANKYTMPQCVMLYRRVIVVCSMKAIDNGKSTKGVCGTDSWIWRRVDRSRG